MKGVPYAFLLTIFFMVGEANAQLWKQLADSAKIFHDEKKLNQAKDYFSRAIHALPVDSAESGTKAQYCYNLGRVYLNLNKFDDAETFLNESREIRQKKYGKISIEYAESCNAMGAVYYYTSQFSKVETFWSEVKDIREQLFGKESLEYAAIAYNLGILCAATGNYTKAELNYNEAIRIREKKSGRENNEYAILCNALGALYQKMGQYEKARIVYEEAKNIREKVLGKDHIDYALTCNNLASIYADLGDYVSAEQFCKEALEIIERKVGKADLEYARTCNQLGIIYFESGQYRKVEPLYLIAQDIWKNIYGNKSHNYAISLNNLGNFYRQTGQYDKAESAHLEAKQIREALLTKNHPDYALSCNNLANVYTAMGQYKKAEAYFLEAKSLRQALVGTSHPDYAHSCNNLADLYSYMERYEEAETLYIQAKLIREKNHGKNHPDYAQSCMSLANLYTNTNKLEIAEPLQLEAKQIYEMIFGKKNQDYANCCNSLAVLYANMKQYERAEALYLESRGIIADIYGKDHADYARNCINLANLNRSMMKIETAKRYYEEAFSCVGNLIDAVFQYTSETEKLAFLNEIANLDLVFFSFSTSMQPRDQQGFAYNVSLNSRNIILSTLQYLKQAIYYSEDSLLKSKYDEWISIKEQLSNWYTKPVSQRPGFIKTFEEKAEAGEKELTRYLADTKKQLPPGKTNWQDIHRFLSNGEAAVEFVQYAYYDGKEVTDSFCYVAFIINKSKAEPAFLHLFSQGELDAVLNIYKGTSAGPTQLNFLYGHKAADSEEGSKTLYDLIWKPLENALAGVHTVYFAPAGSLFKISFAALAVNSSETLSDRYRLVQLNTTATVVERTVHNITASGRLVLYGGVEYDVDSTAMKLSSLQYSGNGVASRSLTDDYGRDGVKEFTYLFGTGKEVAGISRLANQNKYQVSLEEGKNASEESFKALSGKNSPVILHIATHGFFFPDPKNNNKDDKAIGSGIFRQSVNPLIRSGLALSGANNAWKGKPVKGVEDGILTAYEVSNMYFPNTKLAVLSACETGLGDIQGSEGVYGLQRAFKMAGVQNLVMSLWKVPDQETSEFMQQFYKGLFEKQPIGDAFYQAQTTMRDKYRNDPYKWAAWVLIR